MVEKTAIKDQVEIDTGLIGMKQIRSFYDRSEATILDLIRNEGFPAVKIGGGWESDKLAINKWRREKIAASDNGRALLVEQDG